MAVCTLRLVKRVNYDKSSDIQRGPTKSCLKKAKQPDRKESANPYAYINFYKNI